MKIETRRNWGTQSPTYPILDAWLFFLFCILPSQNKKLSGGVIMKGASSKGQEICPALEQKLLQMRCSIHPNCVEKSRPNDRNISMQHIATLLLTGKKFCRNLKWMKLYHPSLSSFFLPHLYHLSSVIAHGATSIFSVGPNSRSKAQLFPMGPHGRQIRYVAQSFIKKHVSTRSKMWKFFSPSPWCTTLVFSNR